MPSVAPGDNSEGESPVEGPASSPSAPLQGFALWLSQQPETITEIDFGESKRLYNFSIVAPKTELAHKELSLVYQTISDAETSLYYGTIPTEIGRYTRLTNFQISKY